ncbi:D-2-hydroxyacid dehydrogenase [Cellulomonas alba]|uniref:D-2-hydroxyacid dehydrogenase n=1 Tax=Cellulomonas alba TaxID=3053467 RepID=A0ABT7SF08_9CELL|nr:D-2-hydroxyacid dehydrogenase [Cellulomonas alba]MDM7854760.1 D-2-hydroxyacid dehydrogenase [Cellulomonas alba]
MRVVVATPMPDALLARLREALPGVDVAADASLMPPQRWPADFAGDSSFRRTPEQQAAFEELVDSADVLYGIPDVSSEALARTVRANPRLRWVQTMAAGGGAQVRAAGLTDDELRRVTFTTSAGVHAGALAEFALLGVLAGAKDLGRLRAQQAGRTWPDQREMRRLSDLTVGVLGLGHIGREAARLLTLLGAHVVGVTRDGRPRGEVADVVPTTELANAARRLDALVVTLPGTEATNGLVDEAVLTALRPGATVVSVGRGSVIDEAALVRALEAGIVGNAVLDVFATEPLPADSPLWAMPQVVVSPHTAAITGDQERLISELFVDNVRHFLRGEPMANVVDTVEFY